MTPIDDERLGQLARAGLQARDPGSTPESLRYRIARVVDDAGVPHGGHERTLVRLGSAAGLVAAAAVVVAVAGLLAVRSAGLTGVGGPSPMPSGLVPSNPVIWPPLELGPPNGYGADVRPILVLGAIGLVVAAVRFVRNRRASRRIRRLAVGIAGGAVAGLFWMELAYLPLVHGSTSGPIQPADQIVTADGASGGSDVVYVRYRSGASFIVGFSVRNEGPVTVTFDGIVDNYRGLSRFHFEDLRLKRDLAEMSVTEAGTQPFRPVDLPPGAELYVVARFRFATCDEEHLPVVPGLDAPDTDTSQGSLVIDRLMVRSHVLLLPRETGVPLRIVAALPQPTRCAH